jgi:hypothetical protein
MYADNVIIRETGLLEWTCEHGCGHPLSSSAKAMAKAYGHEPGTWLTHGCDGCCSSDEFKRINQKYHIKEE